MDISGLTGVMPTTGLGAPVADARGAQGGRRGGVSLTTSWGAPVADGRNSLQAGETGHLLLDPQLLEKNQAFNRERIPERVVHANGVSAHGSFVVTDSAFSHLCKADLFTPGKTTPVFVRFSGVVSEKGGADTTREPRGFAIKFYTGEGNFDLVCNNAPVFFLRDPLLFPDLIHSQKPNPATGLKDPNAYWDFLSHTPESVHLTLMVFGDRGVPFSYRRMPGFANHTFRIVNSQGETHWVKWHVLPQGGVQSLSSAAAEMLAGQDPDFLRRDLLSAIAEGEHPAYDVAVQVIPDADVGSLPMDIFDVTKVVPHAAFPLRKVGVLTLDRNVANDFAENEQVALSPGNLVPGIEAGPDKVFQARLIAYHDAQLYRVGTNFADLPVNAPRCPVTNHTRDGAMAFTNPGGTPSYFTGDASTGGPQGTSDAARETAQRVQGTTGRKLPAATTSQELDDFTQPRALWRDVLTPDERCRLVDNVAAHLKLARPEVQQRALSRLFAPVDEGLSTAIRDAMAAAVKGDAFPSSALGPSALLPRTPFTQTRVKAGAVLVDVCAPSWTPLARAGVGAEPGGGEGGPGQQPLQRMAHLASAAANAGVPGGQHPLVKAPGLLHGVKAAVVGVVTRASVASAALPGESAAGRRE